MKIFPFFLLSFAPLLTGCLGLLPALQPVPELRLSALPTPPHNRPVQIIFPGEAPPSRPYVKIKVLSAKRSAGYPTTNIVKELADQAQREGADAILVLGKNVYAQTDVSTTTTVDSSGVSTSSSSTTWEWQDLSALAIKYTDNVDYLADYVRELRLLQWVDTGWQTAATGSVQYAAPTLWQPSGGTWLDLWRLYDADLIASDAVKNRLRYIDGHEGLRVSNWYAVPAAPRPQRKYRLHLKPDGLADRVEIRLNYPEKAGVRETVRFQYDSEGKIVGRQIDTQAWGRIEEHRIFDEKGKISAVEWTRSGRPFLRMDHVYYTADDIRLFHN